MGSKRSRATVHRAVTAAAVNRPVIVGHSVSGLIATLYATCDPTCGVVNVDQPLDVSVVRGARSVARRVVCAAPTFPSCGRCSRRASHVELLPSAAEGSPWRSMTRVDREVVLGYWSQIFELSVEALNAVVDNAVPPELREQHLRDQYVLRQARSSRPTSGGSERGFPTCRSFHGRTAVTSRTSRTPKPSRGCSPRPADR